MKKIYLKPIICFISIILTINIPSFINLSFTTLPAQENQNDVESVILETSDDGTCITRALTITVFNQKISSANQPAIKEITIPGRVLSCNLEYIGYLDRHDPYLRATTFWLDGRGGAIGTYRVAPGQVRGYGTISPGQTKTWNFDMSHCQFAVSSGTGDVYLNFIPQDGDDLSGYFSPGKHEIKAFISSQDAYAGSTQDTWITIKLHLVIKEYVLTVFDHEFSNWDHPAITTIDIPCIATYARLEYQGHSDPNEPYLRAITFWLDGRGGAIGTRREGPGQVRGYGTISPGQTKDWVFDLSYCQFAKQTGTGSDYLNFLPQSPLDTSGYLSPGQHEVKAYISSQDAYSGPTQDSWITIKLYLAFVIDTTPPVISINYQNGDATDGNPGGPCGSIYPRGLKGQPFNISFMLITKFCVIVLTKNFYEEYLVTN